jgi:DNA-binding PadR family transcriptional regulator
MSKLLKVDNRMRKYYKLTKQEKETVNRLSELEDFIRNMQSLVNPKPSLEF